LNSIWWRWDKSLRGEDNYLSAIVGSIQSIRNGITTILDHHASPLAVGDSLSQVAAGVEAVGLRACLSYEVSDRDGPLSRDQGIAENCRFHHEVEQRKDNRLKNLFGMHAVFSLSDETLRTCSEAATDLGIGCHMHAAEHRTEVEKFGLTHRVNIMQYLDSVGILGPKTLLAHTVHIGSDDIRLLRSTGTFNVHNPVSNMNNGVGAAQILEMIKEHQPVGLGSDGFYDLPNELLTCRLLQNHSRLNPSAFSDLLALRLLYDHNSQFAESIFGCRFGKIEPGYGSDLILVAYEPFTPIHSENLASHIIAALMSGQIQSVFIDGEIVMQNGEMTKVDEAEIQARSRICARQIWDRYQTTGA
jgi:cytosine/adenosine deaminase-related metal-dependent hydrolase